MNWFWVGLMAVLFFAGFELLRRGKTKIGSLIQTRLKTMSARATVSFLISFAMALPFARIDIGIGQRLLLMVLTLGLVMANFIDLESRQM